MAYILGLWWADGHIYKNKFIITQKCRCILELIKLKMGGDTKIIHQKCKFGDSYIFRLSSNKLIKSLNKLGGTSNKTFTCRLPKIPEKYFGDFLRGYFDGDGNIYNGRISFCSGSKDMIYDVYNKLKLLNPNISIYIHYDKRKSGSFSLVSNKKCNVRFFFDLFYKSEPELYLYRKKISFIKILNKDIYR